IGQWQDFLEDEHDGFGNRVSMMDSELAERAMTAGFEDYNGDRFIDEFDLFLKRFDDDGDLAISRMEFTGPDGLIEPELWALMDSLGGPLYEGDVVRDGFGDDVIDTRDM